MDTSLYSMACREVLGLNQPEDLSAAAEAAIAEGVDVPSILMLAGLGSDEGDEARTLFRKAVTELNLSPPTAAEAVVHLARCYAQDILDGDVTPREAAKSIWELTLLVPDTKFEDLDTFVYAASEWDDRPGDSRIFEEGVVSAAQDLVAHDAKSRESEH